ncbi:hypothetical protein OGAPHI_002644 [Ogataea philodendri]|uniref:UDENN FLCN/SMCR8-type domain-containing protein n=1 Tax=Ogataea philodendri TaxID=1378263 RepID=A0A9P8PCD1_9ASCO|nr:uncharacterized protein OGAPHI_002644 [Ogataea philodendri]KAH3668889.1 hypothetical protein OGAPHI_002644 [Ogataea philodendri]
MVMCTQDVDTSDCVERFHGTDVPASSVCESCAFKVPDGSVTLRTHSDNKVYVSTQHPSLQARYAAMRQIIMKIFTIETNYDMSKPLSFGNSKHGYSVGLSFKLRDDTARGSERRYSLIFTSESEQALFSRHSAILDQLNAMVEYVTARSAAIIEDRRRSDNNNESYLRRSSRMPKNRSLIELLQDEELFIKLHLWAASLLEQLQC